MEANFKGGLTSTGVEIQIHIRFVPRVHVNFHTFWGPNLKVPMFCKIEICIKLCVFIIDSKFRALKQQQQLLSSGIADNYRSTIFS